MVEEAQVSTGAQSQNTYWPSQGSFWMEVTAELQSKEQGEFRQAVRIEGHFSPRESIPAKPRGDGFYGTNIVGNSWEWDVEREKLECLK